MGRSRCPALTKSILPAIYSMSTETRSFVVRSSSDLNVEELTADEKAAYGLLDIELTEITEGEVGKFLEEIKKLIA